MFIAVVIILINKHGLSLKSIKIANWLMHLSLIGLNLPKIHNFLRKISIFTSFYRHFMANCNNLRQNVASFLYNVAFLYLLGQMDWLSVNQHPRLRWIDSIIVV